MSGKEAPREIFSGNGTGCIGAHREVRSSEELVHRQDFRYAHAEKSAVNFNSITPVTEEEHGRSWWVRCPVSLLHSADRYSAVGRYFLRVFSFILTTSSKSWQSPPAQRPSYLLKCLISHRSADCLEFLEADAPGFWEGKQRSPVIWSFGSETKWLMDMKKPALKSWWFLQD